MTVILEKLSVALWEIELETSSQIMGFFAKNLYKQRQIADTDFWQAYKTVISPERHRAVGKETGLTNHIERLNNTNRAAGFKG